MMVELDLSRRHFVRHQSGYTLIGTWIRQEDAWRPCLVVLRDGEEHSVHSIPFALTIDQAWKWSEDVGDPHQTAQMTAAALMGMRMEVTPRNAMQFASMIHDHLGDLLSMPPLIKTDVLATPIGELTITDRKTGKQREVLLTDV